MVDDYPMHDRQPSGWQERAACRPTPEMTAEQRQRLSRLFYPLGVIEVEARGWMTKCGLCSVRTSCLRWGLAEEGDGVWGGLYERELAALRSRIAAGEFDLDGAVQYVESKLLAHEPVVRLRRKKRRKKPPEPHGDSIFS